MNKFAKLFDLPEVENQLLITVDYDEDIYWLRARTDIRGLSLAVAISQKSRSEKKLVKVMEGITHQGALDQYHRLEKLANELV